jgi:ATP-dependent Clp protease ATP-binding subunit ClpX
MFEMPDGDEKTLEVTRDYVEDKLNKSTIKKLKAVS